MRSFETRDVEEVSDPPVASIQDVLHIAAANYANRRRDDTRRYRRELQLKPIIFPHESHVWLAHYEGFKAGAGIS